MKYTAAATQRQLLLKLAVLIERDLDIFAILESSDVGALLATASGQLGPMASEWIRYSAGCASVPFPRIKDIILKCNNECLFSVVCQKTRGLTKENLFVHLIGELVSFSGKIVLDWHVCCDPSIRFAVSFEFRAIDMQMQRYCAASSEGDIHLIMIGRPWTKCGICWLRFPNVVMPDLV